MQSCTSTRVRSRNHSPTREARRAVMERSNPSTSDIDSISSVHTEHFGQQYNTVLAMYIRVPDFQFITSLDRHITCKNHAPVGKK